MKYCTEISFKDSVYGRNIINKIKSIYSTQNRPITDNYFTTGFLNAYASQNGKSFNCYQDALEYWAGERYIAIENEAQMAQGNIDYKKWLDENGDPFAGLANLLKALPLVIGALIVYQLVKD